MNTVVENQPGTAVAGTEAKTHILPAVAAPRSTMEMVQIALERGASLDIVERLLALHERYEASQARRAFDAAMSDAKAEIPIIRKNKHVGFKSKDPSKGSTDYDHEDLAEVARTVDPILSKHGLSYRFRVSQTPMITVTCIIAHRSGHFEEVTLSAGADTSGNKNSIQAIGSTATFLQRYTLKLALGLAASKDDDAKAVSASPIISEAQVAELLKIADEAGADKVKFCRYYGIESFAEILAVNFDGAKKALEKKRTAKGAA